MDMGFAIIGSLAPTVGLVSGSCSSARVFAPRFFPAPPRGESDFNVALRYHSRPSRCEEDFHLQTVEHAWHTKKNGCEGRSRLINKTLAASIQPEAHLNVNLHGDGLAVFHGRFELPLLHSLDGFFIQT